LTFEPLLVTTNRNVPDGAVAADTVHAASVAATVSERGSALAPGVVELAVLSVHAASRGTRASAPAPSRTLGARRRVRELITSVLQW
jgi:hypothetical protein